MKIAFYGRYSSDNQRDTSIEDQRRIVERWARRHGHEIVAAHADVAVSGASLQRLTGLRRALDEALATPPPFEALVVDQLSRLSRDVGDTDAIVKRLRFRGIRIVAVNDNIDTADETTKISVTVKSLVNELFLDDLRKTTKRGLDGCFLKGYSTGGRTYGYRSEPVFDPGGRVDPRGSPVPVGYRLVVDPQEAEVVRELFALFVAGHGEKAIAKRFNALYPGRRWRPNTLLLMLQNPKYAGRFFFNRREWVKHPDTGRRVWRLRPREQWDIREFEHLRIVDDATWEAAQRRLRTRRRLFEHGRSATAHLLSGLMLCDECGGRLGIVARDYYGCRTHMELGACSNDLRIHRTAVEQLVIGELARHLPGYIDALAEAAARASAAPTSAGPADDDRPARLATLRRQAEAVMSAIRQGRLSGRALEEALGTYQAVWDEVEALERTARPRQAEPAAVRYDRAVVEDFAARLPEALRADVRLGREFLRETVASIRVTPLGERTLTCPVCGQSMRKVTPQHLGRHGLAMEDGYRRYPRLGFTRRARLLIQPSPDGLLNTAEVFGLVVAGAGFEPATFGL